MRFGVKSDKGRVREINEDCYNIIAGYPEIPVSFIVADGMGGHNSGEVASQMAVNLISNYIMKNPERFADEQEITSAMQEAVSQVNTRIHRVSTEHPDNQGMGTTLVLAVACNKKLFISNIGDSRVYLVRDGEVVQITTDHSYIEELLKNGSITREEAQTHPKRNLITRALGCYEEVDIDTYTCNIKDNDIYLICTDGLSNLVMDEELKDIVARVDEPELACNELVELANSRGGEDNITVIVFKN